LPTPVKPDWEHKLTGTKSRAKDEPEPVIEAGRPTCPKYLTQIERAAFKEIVKILSARGTLTKGDGPAIVLYATTFGQHRALVNELNERGPMVDVIILDSGGNPHTKRVENPAAKRAAQLGNSLRAMLKEFSATPASRERSKKAAMPRPKRVPTIADKIAQLLNEGHTGDENESDDPHQDTE
jgi:P27 family predicted phage terminase small subunit